MGRPRYWIFADHRSQILANGMSTLRAPGLDEAYAQISAGTAVSYLRDASGSVAALTNAAQAAVTGYSYGAYGAAASTGPSGAATTSSAFQYTGADFDSSDQLLYLRNRFYSPQLERFVSEDPSNLGGGLNMYAYANDNPISRKDPLGLWSVTAGIYAVVGGAIVVGQDPETGQWFYGGRLGVGIDAGVSVDAEGKRPGADVDPCNSHGTTVGTFGDAGISLGPLQWSIEHFAGGYDFATGKTYSEGPNTGGLTFGQGEGLDIGGSIGIEVVGR